MMKVAIALISLILFFEDNPDPLRFQDEINSYKQADKTEPPPDGCYLFIGSSSMRMWKSLEEDFKDYPVINRGFGGSHFSDAIYYFEDLILAYNPEKIVIYEGDNDIAGNKSPNTIMKDLKELLGMIRGNLNHPDIAIISAKPSPRRWDLKDKYEKLNAKFKIIKGNLLGAQGIDRKGVSRGCETTEGGQSDGRQPGGLSDPSTRTRRGRRRRLRRRAEPHGLPAAAGVGTRPAQRRGAPLHHGRASVRRHDAHA